MTPEEIEEATSALKAMGLIRDSGRRRNGQIVWVCTDIPDDVAQAIIEAEAEPKQ